LDYCLERFVRRGLGRLDSPVLGALRLGAAEIMVLGHPAYAAVNEAVGTVKARGLGSAGKLVNAALRALDRGWREVPLPTADRVPAAHLAVEFSHPLWLVKEMLGRWPVAEVAAWLQTNQEQPDLGIRVNTLKASREEVAALLATRARRVQPHPLAPESLALRGAAGGAGRLPGFAEGLWQTQDPGATALGHLLGVKPGMAVLDLCAGAGGKTGHLAALMQNQGCIVAVEPAAGRAKGLKENMARLGVGIVEVVEADGRTLPPGLGGFAAALVDAPCSGLGTAGRRPDVRWRHEPADPPRLAALQLALAQAAADALAPDGILLYCTCTVTRAENEGVVEALLASRPELRLEWVPTMNEAARARLGGDGFSWTIPQRDRCDAFFAARLVRRV
jgi:16S rRNA (cytosine967-C5)-methyltransferase